MTSFGLFAFCTTLKKLNTLMANLLLLHLKRYPAYGLGKLFSTTFLLTLNKSQNDLDSRIRCSTCFNAEKGAVEVRSTIGWCALINGGKTECVLQSRWR